MISGRVHLDWNNDNYLHGFHEDVSRDVDPARFEIIAERGKNYIAALSPPAAGRIDFTLTNQEKKYSAENVTSPIHGQREPGIKAQVQVQTSAPAALLTEPGGSLIVIEGGPYAGNYLATEGEYEPFATGYVIDFDDNADFNDKTVGVTCLGAFARLIGNIITTEVYFNISISDALNHLLDAAGWSVDERDIQSSDVILPMWCATEEDAFEAANKLLFTEGPGASWYENRAGYAVFENRYSRITQERSTTAQFEFTDTLFILGRDKKPVYKKERSEVINQARFTIRTRAVQAEQQIFELETGFDLAPYETRRVRVSAANDDPFIDAQIPVTTDGWSEAQLLTANADALAATGTIQLGFGGEQVPSESKTSSVQSPAFAPLDSNESIKTLLEQLSTIGPGNILVSGSISTTGILFRFTGALANKPLELLGVSANLSGSGTPEVRIRRVIAGRKPGLVVTSGEVTEVEFEDGRTSGGYVNLLLTAGADGASVQSLRVNAKPITETGKYSLKESINTSASVRRYGAKPFSQPLWETSDPAEMQSLLDMIVYFNQSPNSSFRFHSRSNDPDFVTYQRAAEISDRNHIVHSQIGIDGDYWIEWIRSTLNQYGVGTEWAMSKAWSAEQGRFARVGDWLETDRLAF